MKLSKLSVTILASLALPVFATPITTDVIAIVDESGSMGGEHAWISSMISSLDSALATEAGTDPYSAQFGLVGFGGSGSHRPGHSHDMDSTVVGTQEFGTSTQFTTAATTLRLDGSIEDGYSGISTALGYTGQTNSVRNLILVTDEDRDNIGGGESFLSMSTDLSNSLLNVVINSAIYCGVTRVLGVDGSGTGYMANGSGGYTTCTGATHVSNSSWSDYGELALTTGGAVWDLNQLRQGGFTADSFTSAFVDIKVKETINVPQPVMEPATFGFLGIGLLGLFFGRKKEKV